MEGRRQGERDDFLRAAAAVMVQPEHREKHDDHFHVRIACPDNLGELCYNESRLGG
jgi:murein endopeptidase